MSDYRGLTLIEVLAATVILTAVATALVPTIQRALVATRAVDRQIRHHDLASLADAVMATPSEYGIIEMPPATTVTMPWPDSPEYPPVTVSVAHASEGHTWVRFMCDGQAVLRWARTEPNEHTVHSYAREDES